MMTSLAILGPAPRASRLLYAWSCGSTACGQGARGLGASLVGSCVRRCDVVQRDTQKTGRPAAGRASNKYGKESNMLAYFKDTSAKILRVQISKCTDAIPQDTFHASLETHARSWPSRGDPLTTAQSAAPAAPKQRQKCTRQRKRYTHTPSRAVDTPTARFRAASAFAYTGWGCPTTGQPRAAAPSPCRRRAARRTTNTHRGGGADRVVRPARVVSIVRATRNHHAYAGRRARSPRTTTSSRGTPSRRGC